MTRAVILAAIVGAVLALWLSPWRAPAPRCLTDAGVTLCASETSIDIRDNGRNAR